MVHFMQVTICDETVKRHVISVIQSVLTFVMAGVKALLGVQGGCQARCSFHQCLFVCRFIICVCYVSEVVCSLADAKHTYHNLLPNLAKVKTRSYICFSTESR